MARGTGGGGQSEWDTGVFCVPGDVDGRCQSEMIVAEIGDGALTDRAPTRAAPPLHPPSKRSPRLQDPPAPRARIVQPTRHIHPAGAFCAYFDDNPNGGLMSFDSIMGAFYAILSVISFDAWTDVMFALMDAFSPYTWVFFLSIGAHCPALASYLRRHSCLTARARSFSSQQSSVDSSSSTSSSL